MRIAFVSDLQLRDDRLGDREDSLRALGDKLDELSVELLVIAGDVFHHRRPGIDELVLFRDWLERLPVDVLIVRGNHDDRGPLRAATIDLFADDPRLGSVETKVVGHPDVFLIRSSLETPDVALGVLPWAHPGRMRAAGFATKAELEDGLLRVAADLAEKAALLDGDAVPVLVTHHALDGLRLPTGLEVRALMAEPILDTRALLAQGWRYVLAGHIHADGLAGETAGREAWSIGVPWRHDFGEQALEPGFLVLDTTADTLRKVELPDRPMLTLETFPDDNPLEVVEGLPAGAIVRLRMKASSTVVVNVAGIRRYLEAAGAVEVKVVVDVERETRARLEASDADELEPLAALEAWIDVNFAAITGDTAEALRELTRGLLEVTR